MCMMNNDGLSTLDNGFLAGKFNGAIKHYKKTAAAIRFDGIRMNRTGKTGRKRAAVERQIVQELNLELRNWSVEMSLLEGDQKMLEAEQANAFDDARHDSWMDNECPECGRYSCRCDELYAMDRGCPDCGCFSCECSMYDRYEAYDYFGADDFYYSPRSFTFTEYPVPMTEEEKMKLSDELWLDHEFTFGRNNLRTMSRYDIMGGDECDYDCFRFDGQTEFGLYAFKPVNEFGGLPDHFDTTFDYRKSNRELTMHDLHDQHHADDTDFTLKLDPMKARRAARFSVIAGGNVKRQDRYGRTHSNRWMNLRGDDKDIERMHDKTAEKRAHRRLLDELFSVEPKKAPKLRFKSMDEKEQYEAQQRKADKRDAGKRNVTKRGAIQSDSAVFDNVDYSLPVRRMVTREVHVTRIGIVDGLRRVISDGVEQMRCRY
jgi:hypothetical protein